MTLDAFVEHLGEQDMSVAAWAKREGFDRHHVYAVINGRLLGTRGVARQILRRMGVALPPVIRPRGQRSGAADERAQA